MTLFCILVSASATFLPNDAPPILLLGLIFAGEAGLLEAVDFTGLDDCDFLIYLLLMLLCTFELSSFEFCLNLLNLLFLRLI